MSERISRPLLQAPPGLIAGLCLLLLFCMALSLARQGVQLRQLLREPVLAPAVPPASVPAVNLQRLSGLFGSPPPMPGTAPHTRLQLRLLASFAHPQAELASAIISAAGERPRRVRIGESLAPGVVLSGVSRDHVTLRRGQRHELLHFPRRDNASTPLQVSQSAPAP